LVADDQHAVDVPAFAARNVRVVATGRSLGGGWATNRLEWNEGLPYNDPKNSASEMEASPDWVKYTIDQPMSEEPGSRFNYSSGASALLAHVFHAATGQDVEEYAAKNLFAPLGIERCYWKRIPSGLADTEGGLYLDRHDLAKLILLFHQKGVWEGRQIVSSIG
jgi:CubicO group peptidase (beta-lactamase class C family)